MVSQRPCRIVGVIGDGGTDRDLIAHIAKNTLEKDIESINLQRQKIRDHVEEYWQQIDRIRDYSLSSEPAKTLVRRISFTLQGALQDLQSFASRILNNGDVIILNTDAEKHLRNADAYFEEWAIIIGKLLLLGIERFYHDLVKQGYSQDCIPMVIPLVLFPSNDIIVVAAKTDQTDVFDWHGRHAHEIKQHLYGTVNLNRLSKNEFERKALSYITGSSIPLIYKHIPETRLFLQTLVWASRQI